MNDESYPYKIRKQFAELYIRDVAASANKQSKLKEGKGTVKVLDARFTSTDAIKTELDRLSKILPELEGNKSELKGLIEEGEYSATARRLYHAENGWRELGNLESVFTDFDLEKAKQELDWFQKKSELMALVGDDKYSPAARRSYNAKNGWKDDVVGNVDGFFSSDFDLTKAKEELDRFQAKSELMDLLQKTDAAGQKIYSSNARRWYAEENGWRKPENFENVFNGFDLTTAEAKLELFQKRSKLKDLLWEKDANGKEIYSKDTRRLFNKSRSNDWRNSDNLETFFNNSDYSLANSRQELNRLETLVDKRSKFKIWLEGEDLRLNKQVLRLFNQINEWEKNGNITEFFTELDEDGFELEFREELDQLKQSLNKARAWKKQIKSEVDGNLFKDEMTINLLKAADVHGQIDDIRNTKAKKAMKYMFDEEGQFQQTEADTYTSQVKQVISDVEVWNDCLLRHDLSKDWNLETSTELLNEMNELNMDNGSSLLLPEDSKFSECFKEFTTALLD